MQFLTRKTGGKSIKKNHCREIALKIYVEQAKNPPKKIRASG